MNTHTTFPDWRKDGAYLKVQQEYDAKHGKLFAARAEQQELLNKAVIDRDSLHERLLDVKAQVHLGAATAAQVDAASKKHAQASARVDAVQLEIDALDRALAMVDAEPLKQATAKAQAACETAINEEYRARVNRLVESLAISDTTLREITALYWHARDLYPDKRDIYDLASWQGLEHVETALEKAKAEQADVEAAARQ